ncbi:MAG: hypothetical protein PHX14_12260, partial [Syntrophomonadaceae bacterium]|nr:hypothetical protein [Syntrophomonadaceae bacterium]
MGKVLKALGGAALGVVTVACLPIAGPVGAISLAGAAIAGTVGGTAGVIADSLEKDKKLQAYNQGKECGKEEAYWEIEEQKIKLKRAAERFIEHKELEDLLYAIFAVGISVSACDGEISPPERQELREFIFG